MCAEQQATTKRHTLAVFTPLAEVNINGDPLRLERVLSNLLSNAIKYSPTGGQITAELSVTEEQERRWAVIRISDQGIGIPAQDQPHIFDTFYRSSNVTGDFRGTGVGLASAAQVVTQHGGTISVASEEMQGSTFIVQLPCTM